MSEYPIIWFEEDLEGGWNSFLTKLKLNSISLEGGGVPGTTKAMQDRLRDLVKACKINGVKVSLPKQATPYTELVKVLTEKGVLMSNAYSDSEDEDDDAVQALKKQHEDEVSNI